MNSLFSQEHQWFSFLGILTITHSHGSARVF